MPEAGEVTINVCNTDKLPNHVFRRNIDNVEECCMRTDLDKPL